MSGNGGCFGFDILFEGDLDQCLKTTPISLGYSDYMIEAFNYDFLISEGSDGHDKLYKWNKFDWRWEKI